MEHGLHVIENMAMDDVNEVYAGGFTPEQVIEYGVARSHEAWTGMVDGEPMCIFGLTKPSFLSTTGHPWMLGTPLLQKHVRPFGRVSYLVVQHWLKTHDHLYSYVHAPHHRGIRWLRFLGFTIHPAEPFGPYGEPFCKFEINRCQQQ